MSIYSYTNTAGQCFSLPERPLEPADCWTPEPEEPWEEDDEDEDG